MKSTPKRAISRKPKFSSAVDHQVFVRRANATAVTDAAGEYNRHPELMSEDRPWATVSLQRPGRQLPTLLLGGPDERSDESGIKPSSRTGIRAQHVDLDIRESALDEMLPQRIEDLGGCRRCHEPRVQSSRGDIGYRVRARPGACVARV